MSAHVEDPIPPVEIGEGDGTRGPAVEALPVVDTLAPADVDVGSLEESPPVENAEVGSEVDVNSRGVENLRTKAVDKVEDLFSSMAESLRGVPGEIQGTRNFSHDLQGEMAGYRAVVEVTLAIRSKTASVKSET